MTGAEDSQAQETDAAGQSETDAVLRHMHDLLGAPMNADGFIHRSGEIIYPAEAADIITPYSAHLRKLIIDACGMGDKPLSAPEDHGDAGNGAGGFYARKVLRPLARTSAAANTSTRTACS